MKIQLLVLLAFLPVPLASQEVRPLARGGELEATLSSDAPQRYGVEAPAGQFVYGEVEQLTVDAVVTVTDPDGEEVGRFDTLDRGAEPFTFDTEAGGVYTVEVAADGEGEGDYRIRLLHLEAVATDPAARVDQLMRPFTGDDRPGVVVGVVVDGSLRFSRAYGMANLDHGIPFRVGTISNIGSVTKQFTAMGLLLLEQAGKLSLDDDVRDHIAELPDFGDPVTIRHLLNHTGGYREIYNLLPLTGYEGEDAFARERAIDVVQRQPERQAPPATEFNYNNTGFILLSLIVERVTGEPFDRYMSSAVFEPLGMTDTRVKMVQGEIIPGSAQGYVSKTDGGYRTARDLAASAGAGGIYTTVSDLAKWMLNYREHTLGGQWAVDQMTTSAVLASGDSTGYGLGLGVQNRRGQTLYAHTGGDVAHRAYFGYYPEIDGGVVAMSNNGFFNPGMGTRIADAFFEDSFESDSEGEDDAGSGVEVPLERLEAYAGDWVLDVGPKIVVTVEDGSLRAQVEGQSAFTMTATSDTTFSVPEASLTVTFHVEADGSTSQATLFQGGEIGMRRAEAGEMDAETLADYAGRYFSPELEVYYELTVEDGVLRVDHTGMQSVELSHTSGDDFSGSAFFMASVSFRRAGNGDVTGFEVSNGRTKGVWFRKEP